MNTINQIKLLNDRQINLQNKYVGKQVYYKNITNNNELVSKNNNVSFCGTKKKLVYRDDPFNLENYGALWYATEEDKKSLSTVIENIHPEDIEKLVKKDSSLLMLKQDFQATNNGINNAYIAFNNILNKFSNVSNQELYILKNNLSCESEQFRPGLWGASQIMTRLSNGINIYSLPNNTADSLENLRTDHELIVSTFAPSVTNLHNVYDIKLNSIKEVVPSIASVVNKHKEIENKTFDTLYQKVDSNYKFFNKMDDDLCSHYEKILTDKLVGKGVGRMILKLLTNI